MRAILTIILVIILCLGLVFFLFFNNLADIYSPTYSQIELVSSKNDKLYIKAKNWGVTGDHQLTIITSEYNNKFEIDSTRQIIFKELEPFLYRSSGDTLFLILRQKSKIPTNFKSQWTIIQMEVDNPTMMNLMRDNEYKRM